MAATFRARLATPTNRTRAPGTGATRVGDSSREPASRDASVGAYVEISLGMIAANERFGHA